MGRRQNGDQCEINNECLFNACSFDLKNSSSFLSMAKTEVTNILADSSPKTAVGMCLNENSKKTKTLIIAMMGLFLLCLIPLCFYKVYLLCFKYPQSAHLDDDSRSDNRRIIGRLGVESNTSQKSDSSRGSRGKKIRRKKDKYSS